MVSGYNATEIKLIHNSLCSCLNTEKYSFGWYYKHPLYYSYLPLAGDPCSMGELTDMHIRI